MKSVITAVVAAFLSTSAAMAADFTLVGEDDWYPYAAKDFTDADKAEPTGWVYDLVSAAFASQQKTVDFKVLPYARCMKLVEDGAELGCFNTNYGPQYEAEYLFHKEPLFTTRVAIVGRKDAAEIKPGDLSGKTVAFTLGYDYGETIDRNAAIKRDTSPNTLFSFRKVSASRADYAVAAEKVAEQLIAGNPEFKTSLKIVGYANDFPPLFVAFDKGNPKSKEAASILDAGLRAIRASGTYAKIEKEWAGKIK